MAETNAYLGRITSQHREQPKFTSTVNAVTMPIVELKELLEEIRRGFDLDDAVGVQLDQVGEWVGRSRDLLTPLEGVYFAWDEAGVGWGEGTWKGLYDPETGLIKLPDDTYRMLLKAKVAANSWDGTRDGAYEIWKSVFADRGLIVLIQDNQDMSIIIGVAGAPMSGVFQELLIQGYIPLKPAGVSVEYYAVPPRGIGGALFAWNCDSDALNGWDKASWPQILTQKEAGYAA